MRCSRKIFWRSIQDEVRNDPGIRAGDQPAHDQRIIPLVFRQRMEFLHDAVSAAIGSVAARLRLAVADDLDIRPLARQQGGADMAAGEGERGGAKS